MLKYIFSISKASATQKNQIAEENDVDSVVWELLWKKSVGHGRLCRLKMKSSQKNFKDFEVLIQEWATSPLEMNMACQNMADPSDRVVSDTIFENGENHVEISSLDRKIDSRRRNTFQKNKEIKIGEQSCMLLAEHVEVIALSAYFI